MVLEHAIVDTASADAAAFRDVRQLYHDGLYLKAYERAKALGPLWSWRGLDALILGGRLAMQVGGHRLGTAMHYAAWRAGRDEPLAIYYYARILMSRGHPLRMLDFLEKHGDLPDAPAFIRADWLALKGLIVGRMRDFDAAEKLMDEAERIEPNRAWIYVERSSLCRFEDATDAALEAAKRALELRPWYRPAVSSCADCLLALGRDDEALALLSEASEKVESQGIYLQMSMIHNEAERFSDARRCLEQGLACEPLVSDEELTWYHCRISDASYRMGDYATAAEYAAKLKDNEFYAEFARRTKDLATDPAAARPVVRKLPVGFVQQHRLTCAPATLAAIGRFWSMPVEHLEVAAEICYDGTPDFTERRWADTNGWKTQEFTGNWDDTVALIDRGIPFTLTTTEVTSGHLQAVIGYDACRQTLIVRDPSSRHFREFIAENLWKRYASVGPRAMAMVPAAQAALFDGLKLKDAKVFDRVYELNLALDRHDRASAQKVLDALNAEAPEHRLALQARRALAGYDGDCATRLACAEEYLRRYPGDPRHQLGKLGCLRELGRRSERLAMLKEICDLTPREKTPKNETELEAPKQFDPIFWHIYGSELSDDARSSKRALELLRLGMRYEPWNGANYWQTANIYWNNRQFEEALRLYRFAACMDDKDVRFVRSYFIAAQHFKRQEEVLALLAQRFKRFGRQSSDPALSLHSALQRLDRTPEAAATLNVALDFRPDDGALLLFAAEAACGSGDEKRAAELLARAESRSKRADWLQASARLARVQGDLKRALELCRESARLEPLSLDSQRAVARLLAELEGPASAVEYVRKVCERFPHHVGLHQVLTEWLRNDQPEEAAAVLRHMLEIDDADAWIHRELALTQLKLGKVAEARASAEEGLRLEPNRNFSHSVHAQVLAAENRVADARAALKEAIRLSADSEHAIGELMRLSESPEERREALAFVHGELVRQTTFGDGWLTFRDHAATNLEPEALLASLREALRERPDLWACWSVVVQQLIAMIRLDEALETARDFTTRFPLVSRSWLDLAEVHRARHDSPAWIAALEKAVQIDAAWGYSVRSLGEAYIHAGELNKARELLEQAAARSPLDQYNHSCLADVLWRLGEREAALDRLCVALRVEPHYEWAWRHLDQWAGELNQRSRVVDMARETTRRRSGSTESWLNLARCLRDNLEERLAAIQKALDLDPRCADALDLRALLLTENARYDEALAACAAPAGMTRTPTSLQGRKAWIEAERGNLDAAIATMQAVLKEESHYDWGWRRLAEWTERKGDLKAFLEACEGAVKVSPHDSGPLGYLGHAQALNGQRDAAKKTFRLAIEIRPDYDYALNYLFDLHFEDNETADAEKILEHAQTHCAHSGPLTLDRLKFDARRNDKAAVFKSLERLCEIKPDIDWVLREAFKELNAKGWGSDASQTLTSALERDADYYFGWKQVYDEAFDRKDDTRLVEAAREMARLRPDSAVAFGYLGEAFQKVRDESEAIRAFARALELNPKYQYAARCLFDLHLRKKDTQEATRILKHLRVLGIDQFYRLKEINLWVHLKSWEMAVGAFADLCVEPTAEEWAFEEAIKAMPGSLTKSINTKLTESLSQPKINRPAAQLWFKRCHLNSAAAEKLLSGMLDDSSRHMFVTAWLEHARVKRDKTEVRRIVGRHAALLRNDTLAWGMAGNGLNDLDCFGEAIAWMADWRERKELRPWMLVNLAMSLRATDRIGEAHEVSEFALTLSTGDHGTRDHVMFLANDELLAGNAKRAAERIAVLPSTQLQDWEAFMHKCLTALVELEDDPTEFVRFAKELAVARHRLLGGSAENFKDHVLMAKMYRIWVRKGAAISGGVWPKIWAAWRVLRSHLLID